MSDHIPYLTKMISDTPRTESFNCYDSGCDDPLHAWGAFSAELERELNAANQRISKLNDYVAALETAGDEMAKELSYGYDVDLWNKARGEANP